MYFHMPYTHRHIKTEGRGVVENPVVMSSVHADYLPWISDKVYTW